jgi:hypothetical protein
MKYAIANWADKEALTQEKKDELIGLLIESSWDTCRRTISGTDKFIGKWDSETCPFDTVELAHTDYIYAEILVEIEKPEWTSQEV